MVTSRIQFTAAKEKLTQCRSWLGQNGVEMMRYTSNEVLFKQLELIPRSYSSNLCVLWHICILSKVRSFWPVNYDKQVTYESPRDNEFKINKRKYYLLSEVFRTSFRGARRPLTRVPEVHLKDDITETNLSIDFSAISEYWPKWEMFVPNFSSSPLFSVTGPSTS